MPLVTTKVFRDQPSESQTKDLIHASAATAVLTSVPVAPQSHALIRQL
jgi:phenylpyruvate tautomerase PptA (4-oxalocrotonate tautomerase family)